MLRDAFRNPEKALPFSLPNRAPELRSRLLLLCMALAVTGISLPFPLTGVVPAEAGQSRQTVDSQRLAGQWVRPDGGYILELKDIKKEGSLKASYYNPRPINVAVAEVRRSKGGIGVFVELRDVNYPGSKYDLRYDPAADRLKGTYYQAVEKQTYDVEFVRMQ
jgi:hypothetical protein